MKRPAEPTEHAEQYHPTMSDSNPPTFTKTIYIIAAESDQNDGHGLSHPIFSLIKSDRVHGKDFWGEPNYYLPAFSCALIAEKWRKLNRPYGTKIVAIPFCGA